MYVANLLLLHAYGSVPKAFAEEAISALLDSPDRLYAGYSDAPFWISRTVIEKCSPLCSEELFRKFEAKMLKFMTPWERTAEAVGHRGSAAFTLLSALATERTSLAVKQRVEALREKFGCVREPNGITSVDLVSPISRDAAQRMTDGQWFGAVSKYDSEQRRYFDHTKKGGAYELANLLQHFAELDPERFAKLSLKFPEGTNSHYYTAILAALKDSSIPFSLKSYVVRNALAKNSDSCTWYALDLLARAGTEEIPQDLIDFIASSATCHDDSNIRDEKDASPSRLSIAAQNTVRAHAASTIAELIRSAPRYLQQFEPAIQDMMTDTSLAVRACAARMLWAVVEVAPQKIKAFFVTLVGPHDRLLATEQVQKLLRYLIEKDIEFVQPYLERMLNADHPEIQEAGGRLSALAGLFHDKMQFLASRALNGSVNSRLGVAKVASRNVIYGLCRDWCEPTLKLLFNDESEDVRKEAAHSFSHLWHTEDVRLADYEDLISEFFRSKAFLDEPTYLIHALEDTKEALPALTFQLCENFINRCAEKARDIRTRMAAIERTIARLVFRLYAQAEAGDQQGKVLDLIDRMCEEGFNTATKSLLEYDR